MPPPAGTIPSEAILDASVVVKWLFREDERHLEAAQSLQSEFESGGLRVVAPPLIWFEVLNTAANRTRRSAPGLRRAAEILTGFPIAAVDPELAAVAEWSARGLTAYDAAYVAAAEAAGLPLITDDDQIVAVAPEIARPLAEFV